MSAEDFQPETLTVNWEPGLVFTANSTAELARQCAAHEAGARWRHMSQHERQRRIARHEREIRTMYGMQN